MTSGTPYIQSANTIEYNIRQMGTVEGLDAKTWYATIAIAQMMYEDYLEKQKLKSDVVKYEVAKKHPGSNQQREVK